MHPGDFADVDGPFSCAAAFAADSHAERSDVRVDGVDAYDPWHVYADTPATPPAPMSVAKSFDPATGLATVTTREPIFRCASAGYPASNANCPTVTSTGVELDRTYATSADGHVADVTDAWTSTDGRPHTLNLLVRTGMVADPANGGAYELPGQSSFATPVVGPMSSFPSGPGTILYKVDAQTVDVGDNASPQGSISYSSAPDGAGAFTAIDHAGGRSEFTLPYVRTVPAGGAFTLKMRFAEDFALAPVQAAAAEAVAQYAREAQTPPSGGGAPKPPSGPASPQLRIAGKPRVSGATATVKVSCTGAPCPLAAALTTTEHLSGRKVTGVSARKRRKTVKVATRSLTIPAGATATLKLSLNRTGKSLLARFGRLPTTLRLTSSGRTVATARATFKRKRRHH